MNLCLVVIEVRLVNLVYFFFGFFFFKQKTAYEMRISDWSSDVCSSDLEWRDFERGCRSPAWMARRKRRNPRLIPRLRARKSLPPRGTNPFRPGLRRAERKIWKRSR